MSLALASGVTALLLCAPPGPAASAAPCQTAIAAPTPDRSVTDSRPAGLVGLYALFGAAQTYDTYTTFRALQRGAREANPVLPPLTPNVIAASAIKAASVATTIYFAERLWRRHRVAAIVMMAGINGVTVGIALHNASVARRNGR